MQIPQVNATDTKFTTSTRKLLILAACSGIGMVLIIRGSWNTFILILILIPLVHAIFQAKRRIIGAFIMVLTILPIILFVLVPAAIDSDFNCTQIAIFISVLISSFGSFGYILILILSLYNRYMIYFTLPLVWMLFEYIAGKSMWRNHPIPFALSCISPESPIIRWAQYGGSALVSMIIILISCSIYGILFERHKAAFIAGFVAMMFVISAMFIPHTGKTDSMKFGIVQANVSDLWRIKSMQSNEVVERILYEYSILTKKATKRARIIIWPELAIPGVVEYGKSHEKILQAMNFAELVLAGATYKYDDKLYNSILIKKNGVLKNMYEKQVLVPYMEDWATSGQKTGVSEMLGQFIGGLICLDIVNYEIVIKTVLKPSNALVILVNTPQLQVFNIQRNIIQLRAVEVHRDIIIASQFGGSGVASADGQLRDIFPWNTSMSNDVLVNTYDNITFWVRYNRLFPVFCIMLLIIFRLCSVSSSLSNDYSKHKK